MRRFYYKMWQLLQNPTILLKNATFIRKCVVTVINVKTQFLVFLLDLIWNELALLWRRPLSYRNQSIDLRSRSMDWFLYDNDLRHERVKWMEVYLNYWKGNNSYPNDVLFYLNQDLRFSVSYFLSHTRQDLAAICVFWKNLTIHLRQK